MCKICENVDKMCINVLQCVQSVYECAAHTHCTQNLYEYCTMCTECLYECVIVVKACTNVYKSVNLHKICKIAWKWLLL